MWALKYIALKTGVHLPLDEAGFIAMHIINSRSQDHKNRWEEILTFSKQILHIIEVTMHIDWKEKDLIKHTSCNAHQVSGTAVLQLTARIKQDFNDKMYRDAGNES